MSSQQGMQTLDQALRKLVESGEITLEEALVRAHRPQDLKNKLLHAATQGNKYG
jgi:Tfp pilus assembly ATPase PilU